MAAGNYGDVGRPQVDAMSTEGGHRRSPSPSSGVMATGDLHPALRVSPNL